MEKSLGSLPVLHVPSSWGRKVRKGSTYTILNPIPGADSPWGLATLNTSNKTLIPSNFLPEEATLRLTRRAAKEPPAPPLAKAPRAPRSPAQWVLAPKAAPPVCRACALARNRRLLTALLSRPARELARPGVLAALPRRAARPAPPLAGAGSGGGAGGSERRSLPQVCAGGGADLSSPEKEGEKPSSPRFRPAGGGELPPSVPARLRGSSGGVRGAGPTWRLAGCSCGGLALEILASSFAVLFRLPQPPWEFRSPQVGSSPPKVGVDGAARGLLSLLKPSEKQLSFKKERSGSWSLRNAAVVRAGHPKPGWADVLWNEINLKSQKRGILLQTAFLSA